MDWYGFYYVPIDDKSATAQDSQFEQQVSEQCDG